MFRNLPKLFASKIQVHVPHNSPHQHQVLYDLMRNHFLETFKPHSINPEKKQVLLHEAIMDGDYDLAKKFLDRSNIFAKDNYGDTPITIALENKAWGFLDYAKQFVTNKSTDTGQVLGIIAQEINADTQTEMLGHAKEFFEIS
jgi:hypothetical protein